MTNASPSVGRRPPENPNDEDGMKANEIMTRDPSVVTPETPVQEAARLMKDEDTGILPVVEGVGSRRLLGVVTDRDITIRVVAEGRMQAQVRDAMTEGVKTCGPDDDVNDVMQVMANEQVRRVPIVDERGDVVGIVSQADVVLEADDDRRAEETIERISEPNR